MGNDRRMACEFLEKARSKISTMVVGLDFYTTSPSFLESFLSVIRIGKALQGGTFHPKLYLFEIADRFGCVMGSSNFTRGGFGDNAELNICIEGKESDAFFRQVEVFIEEQEKHSDPITAPEIAARKWAESGLAAESEAMESVGCISTVFQTRSRGDRSGEFQDRETSR
jgi:HKD family nuclease